MRREVRLKPAFVANYPDLEPEHWYTAAAVAGFVKGQRIVSEGADTRIDDRVLAAEHFEFRGGGPRRGIWMGMRTRRIDRHARGPRATAGATLHLHGR